MLTIETELLKTKDDLATASVKFNEINSLLKRAAVEMNRLEAAGKDAIERMDITEAESLADQKKLWLELSNRLEQTSLGKSLEAEQREKERLEAEEKARVEAEQREKARLDRGGAPREAMEWASQYAHADMQIAGGTFPLHIASENGHRERVLALLQRGADVLAKNSAGSTALQLALEKGHADCASLLQTNARDDDRNTRNTPLHTAAEGGDLARVSQLVDAGAVLDANSNKGYTALELAVEKGHASVAALLRSKGARDPEERDSDRDTPLSNASSEDDSARVAHLLSQGADPSTRDQWGGTPLHWASYYGYMEVVELLLARGVPINSRDCNGSTPLRAATYNGRTAVAELLRSKGGIE